MKSIYTKQLKTTLYILLHFFNNYQPRLFDMEQKYKEITPKFSRALNNILSNNLAEKVIVKITNVSITFFYTVSTVIKDIHRKLLKNAYCDQVVTTVHNEITEFKTTFNLISSVSYTDHYMKVINPFTIEILKILSVPDSMKTFVSTICNNKSLELA